VDGINVNYVKVGSGPKPILCLPGALGQYSFLSEYLKLKPLSILWCHNHLLMCGVNLHALSHIVVPDWHIRLWRREMLKKVIPPRHRNLMGVSVTS
jgi:hypothetical protein